MSIRYRAAARLPARVFFSRLLFLLEAAEAAEDAQLLVRAPEDELPRAEAQPAGHEALVQGERALVRDDLLEKRGRGGWEGGEQEGRTRKKGGRPVACGCLLTLRQQSRVPLYGIVPSGRAVCDMMRDLATSAGVEQSEATKPEQIAEHKWQRRLSPV